MSSFTQSYKTKKSAKIASATKIGSTSSADHAEKENTSSQSASLTLKDVKRQIHTPSLPSRKVLGELNTAQVQARDALYGRQENQDDASTSMPRTRTQPGRQTRSSVIIRDDIQPSSIGARDAAERGGSAGEAEGENVPVTSKKRSTLRKAAATQSAARRSCGAAVVAACDGQLCHLKLHQSVAIARGSKKAMHLDPIMKSSLKSSSLLHFKLI